MLSCNGIVLNYAFVMYNKSISKIDMVQSIAKELPVPPVMSYFLCDCWYVSEKIINTFAERAPYHRCFENKPFAVSIGNEKLSCYVCRWPIGVFFRQCKDKLALDGYQIRSSQGIKRYWLLMSLAHFMCAVGTGRLCSLETGYHEICDTIQLEKYRYFFQCAKESNDFDSFMKFVV